MGNDYLEGLISQIESGEIKMLQPDDKIVVGCERCGRCCRNRNDILLYPYDIIKICRAKGIGPETVVEKYGDPYIGENSHFPIVALRFRIAEDGSTKCPFLGKMKDGLFGCRIHENKPWVCRMYPLGIINNEFFLQPYVKSSNYCPGREKAEDENSTHTVTEWIGGEKALEIHKRDAIIRGKFLDLWQKVYESGDIKTHELYEIRDFYGVVRILYYFAYSEKAIRDDEVFLEEFKSNTELILDFGERFITKNKSAHDAMQKLVDRIAPAVLIERIAPAVMRGDKED